MKVTVKFRPLEDETLALLMNVWDAERDPVATYSRLISAAMMAGAIVGVTPQQVSNHAPEFLRQARKAVQDRTDIFGGDDASANQTPN